jgi:hypothetical protein
MASSIDETLADAALRLAGDNHVVAHLDAINARADLDHGADAAVSGNHCLGDPIA